MADKTNLEAKHAGEQITRANATWGPSVGSATDVTYAYRSTPGTLAPGLSDTFTRFSAEQIAATDEALSQWSDLANIRFIRAGSGTEGDAAYSNDATILFGRYANVYDAPAHSNGGVSDAARGSALANGDLWLNTVYGGTLVDKDTLLHETGHSIGLAHPGPYDSADDDVTHPAGDPANRGPISYEKDAIYRQDTKQYSLMSYWSEELSGADHSVTLTDPMTGDWVSLKVRASTPLIHDIAAVQRLYGANLTTETGDTVYGFNSNAHQTAYHIDEYYTIDYSPERVVFAIWDAGGTDTLDLSGYTQDQSIDLAPGAFSDAGGLKANISLAEAVDSSGRISGSAGFDPNAVVNWMENAVGGSGSDHITGNEVANRLEGRDGNDFLYGNGGRDQLIGGFGDDTLDGGIGRDRMVGGAGNDTYYATGEDELVEDAIVMTRSPDGLFGVVGGGIDSVVTTDTRYALGTNLENLTYSYYDPFTAAPSFHGIGNELDNVIRGGASDDILEGGDGNDRLIGNGGADAMYGGVGDDTYVVDSDADQVIESFGEYRKVSDEYFTGRMYVPGGIDTVETARGFHDLEDNVENLTFTGEGKFTGYGNRLDNVITGGAGVDMLLGFDGADTLIGNGGGDVLVGGAGNDTLRPGSAVTDVADHTLNGGSGSDTLDFSTLNGRVEFDLGRRTLTATELDPQTGSPASLRVATVTDLNIVSVENVTGSAYNDTLVGDAGANVIDGGAGRDTLAGGIGNDTLIGGADYDHFIYSGRVADIGVDTVYGSFVDGTSDNSANAIEFTDLDGHVDVDLAAYRFTAIDDATSATGSVYDVRTVVGSARPDTITGDAQSNILDGGAGADVMAGGEGLDTYVVDDAGDQVIERAGEGDGDSVATSLAKYELPDEVEILQSDNIVSAVPKAFHGIGNGGKNELYSGQGNDTLEGGGGADLLNADSTFWGEMSGVSDDVLIGGAGDDELQVRYGRDTLVFEDGWGADRVYGFTPGSDLLDFRGVTGVASLDDLGRQVFIDDNGPGLELTYAGNSVKLYGVTSLLASSARFAGQPDPRGMVGDEGANELIGTLDGDALFGLGGDDTLIGLAGADVLDGGSGVDTASYAASAAAVSVDLAAGTGHGGDAEGDTLTGIENVVGSAHADTLTGGADRGNFQGGDGDDALTGGSWFDWMEGGDGRDTITGAGGQTVQFGGDGDDTLTGSLDDTNYFAGGLGNDVMTGGNTTDYISDVDGGDDVMHGGGGADTLVDYQGANQMFGEDGDDFVSSVGSGSYLDGGAGNDYLSTANGDYTLVGGAGDDTLEHAGHGLARFSGGEGADVFTYRLFGNGPISYAVSDFEDGIDKILLWDNKYYGDTNPNLGFDDLTIADSEAGAVISWNGTSEMTLAGIAADQITVEDFQFA